LDSTWRDLCWRIELFNIIQNLDIEGVTGRIRFQNGDRLGEIVIEQILVSPSPKLRSVEIVKLFVAVPTDHSKYVLLQNSYTAAGKARLLHNNVTNILIAALEEVGKEEIDNLPLSIQDIDALHHVKELIETHCPVYPGNDVLIKKARNTLNAFKLSYGFKRLFGVSPYEYFQEQRFLMAKGLLREGNKVNSVAHELEYESSTAFIKAFRQRFHRTPKQFQKSGG